jgi:hypothetical protein
MTSNDTNSRRVLVVTPPVLGMASNGRAGYVTLGVSPNLREILREERDEHEFDSYEQLIRAMYQQYNPEESGD